MKKIAILTLLLTAKAFAHEATPQTKFFQDEVKKNPMTQNILVWCSLIGIDSEDSCRSEMYRNGDTLDPVRLEAASKCVDKSGMKYRVAFDEFFKSNANKLNTLADVDFRGKNHLYPVKGPKGSVWEKEHYYYYSALEKQMAAFKLGDDFVARAKKLYEGMSTSDKTGAQLKASAQGDVAIIKVLSEFLVSRESSTTKPALSPEVLERIQDRGQEFGSANPAAAGIEPSGVCFVGGICTQDEKQFPESQLMSEVNKNLLPKPQGSEPKVIVIEVPAGELHPQDPFAPFTSGTATGGMPTEKPKVNPDKPEDTEKPKTNFGPDDKEFKSRMNDCLTTEENKILKDQGSKTLDQDAQTKEDKEAEALQKLKNGECDENFYGSKFCASWKNEQAKSQAQNAEADKQAAYEEAFKNWQVNGICDSMVLGFAFCQNAHSQLVSTPTDSESPDTGTIADGVTQLDSAVPVEGAHISTDVKAWHPPETSPNDL